tara:strand:- start:724 stop:1452 length:729 start_codon:yes stop_codon:yes gene_type:complete
MGTFYNPKIPDTNNLIFAVDFGNPKFNNDELINGISHTASGVTLNTTYSTGYVENDAGAGYLEYNSTIFSTSSKYNLTNGFSGIAILTINGFSGQADQNYKGIFGTGNSFTDRLINLWFQKSSGSLRLHQSSNNSTNSGYVGSFSSTFTAPSDGTIFMVGYSHSLSSITYYVHGQPLSTHSIGTAIRTTWPSRNDMYVSAGNDANAKYYSGGKIYMVLLYNKPLTATEHSSCFNIFQNRFSL